MTRLERRCRFLLRAYPSGYREERGEEIIGTLLEATPDGRSWPRFRDIRALIVAGLRARAAQSRRLSTATNMRLAVLFGAGIYLSLAAAGYLSRFALSDVTSANATLILGQSGWLALLNGLLLAAAVLSVFIARRRAVVLCCTVAAGAALAYCTVAGGLLSNAGPFTGYGFARESDLASVACELLCLVVLIVLAGRAERPSLAWLVPIGLLVAVDFLPALGLVHWAVVLLLLSVPIGIIAWIVIDARPAIGLVIYLMLSTLALVLRNLQGPGLYLPYPFLAVAAAIAGPAVWRLRRQSLRRQPVP